MLKTGVVAAVLALTLQALPPARPNFAGEWVIDLSQTDEPSVRENVGLGFSPTLISAVVTGYKLAIDQDQRGVKITRVVGTTPVLFSINFDGTESRTMVPGLGGPWEDSSKAEWQGSRLVISTVMTSPKNPNKPTAVQLLSRSGRTLIAEYQRKSPSTGVLVSSKIGYRNMTR